MANLFWPEQKLSEPLSYLKYPFNMANPTIRPRFGGLLVNGFTGFHCTYTKKKLMHISAWEKNFVRLSEHAYTCLMNKKKILSAWKVKKNTKLVQIQCLLIKIWSVWLIQDMKHG